MTAPCTRCGDAGVVPLYAGAGFAACPRCFARAEFADRMAELGVSLGEPRLAEAVEAARAHGEATRTPLDLRCVAEGPEGAVVVT